MCIKLHNIYNYKADNEAIKKKVIRVNKVIKKYLGT